MSARGVMRALYIPGALVALVLVIAFFTAGDIWISGWSEPAREQIRADTHRESQVFIEGTVSQVRRYQIEHASSDSEHHRQIIERLAVKEADKIDDEHLPDDLMRWVDEIRDR